MRTGLIAQKLGMTRVFTGEGQHVPVTVLKVDACQVVAVRTQEKDGYTAVQLGSGRGSGVHPHDITANGVVTHESEGVHADAVVLPGGDLIGHLPRASAVQAQGDRGDPLGQKGPGIAHPRLV